MIVPMKRLTLLCVASEKKAALARLASMGALHIDAVKTDGEGSSAARADAQAASRALSAINAALAAKGKPFSIKTASANSGADPLVSAVNNLADNYNATQDSLRALDTEIAKYTPFGNFEPADANKLAAAGITLNLFKAPAKKFPKNAESIEIISKDKNTVYFVEFGAPNSQFSILNSQLLPLPARSLAKMREERDTAIARLSSIAEKLREHGTDIPAIKKRLAECGGEEEYWTAFETMKTEKLPYEIAHISGYIDARKSDEFNAAAASEGWGAALRDPTDDESPPVALEPPRIFRPITALFKALDIVPGYTESDVSVPFYIFFTIFFAMLIGDAGYGSIILALTAFAQLKTKKNPLVRSTLILFYVFGGATVFYGMLSGTYFGMPQEFIPQVLQFKSIEWLGNMNNIMRLCFTLGAIHLSLARFWNAAALAPSTKALAELGWAGIIWSMYMIICGIVVADFAYPAWGPYAMCVSILMVALFMLKPSELKKEGVALGMLPLNIMSAMGDIISYVRLFAVGLASVKVAENFNTMATGFDFPLWLKIPVMALILLIGHGLNFAMGALSILVHAVRLNTLEFSGAKGVTWGGVQFKAFKAEKRS